MQTNPSNTTLLRRMVLQARSIRHLGRWLPSRGNVVFTLAALALFAFAARAGAVPLNAPAAGTSTGTIPYQGRLATAAGEPVTQSVPVVFRLYTVASGGTPLWQEHWTGANSVSVADGLFNVMLGSLTPISRAVLTDNESLFLGITVGSDSEMVPRVQLGSVPYAVQALTVPDGSITSMKLDDSSVVTEKIADDAITAAKLAPGVLDGADLALENVRANVVSRRGEEQKTAANGVWVDLLSVNIDLNQPSTLRVNFHSLVWKTVGAGRTALAIRINGTPNSHPGAESWVSVGTRVSSSWSLDSQFLSDTYYVDVPEGSHDVTLVMGSWDGGTAHARTYGIDVEVLAQP